MFIYVLTTENIGSITKNMAKPVRSRPNIGYIIIGLIPSSDLGIDDVSFFNKFTE